MQYHPYYQQSNPNPPTPLSHYLSSHNHSFPSPFETHLNTHAQGTLQEESLLEDETLVHSKIPNEGHYEEMKQYCRSMLSNWGVTFGVMPYSYDNQNNLNCMLELANYHTKDLQLRSKMKDDIAAVVYEKDRFRSLWEQSQKALQETQRKLGRVQNQILQTKNKIKKEEAISKRQREQDRKVILALRAKNEQILHEVKKKQQEVARVKEQMKKSIGERLTQPKNSFEVFEGLTKLVQKESAEQCKYIYLLQRNERQTSNLNQQNAVLRQKIYDIREVLVSLGRWVDQELFGEKEESYNKIQSFILNHNLLYKKESLVKELQDLSTQIKQGIIQLRDLARNRELPEPPSSPLRKVSKSEYNRPKMETQNRQKNLLNSKEKPLTSSIKVQRPQKPTITGKPIFQSNQEKPRKMVKQPSLSKIALHEAPFIDEMLSQVGSGHESSLMSHLDIEKFGSGKLEKWDILYQDDS